jgi:transcriptional regulator with GAF, ATPase, and Fis domain
MSFSGRSEAAALLLSAGDPEAQEILRVLEKIADTNVTVLVRGETGTGKGLVARALHQLSARRRGPFVSVNCAALPAGLLESELFGFEKGAFTGAVRRKKGRFEIANRGTLFLDEIGELPPALQAKLLQVLQDGEFSALGSEGSVFTDARIVVATNRNLERAVEDGDFRKDLYYRLNEVSVRVPALRERPAAIPVLASYFLQRYNAEYSRDAQLSDEVLEAFVRFAWPGNVRQLENLVRRIVVLGSEKAPLDEIRPGVSLARAETEIEAMVDRALIEAENSADPSVDLFALAKSASRIATRPLLEAVLNETDWNRARSARRLGISSKSLTVKIRECGLRRRP